MASPIVAALIYLAFALTFGIFNYMVFDIRTGSEMFQAVAYKFTRTPWNPGDTEELYMKDVADPGNVFQWLNNTWRHGVRDLERNTADGEAQHSLNRVLFGRLTLKRFKFTNNESHRFKGNYEQILGRSKMEASSSNGDDEETSPFGGLPYTYKTDKGYQDAGGYVLYINPDEEQSIVDKQIADTAANGWFDLRFGSLVAEIILFNGNVKKFFLLTFIFEADSSGVIETRTDAVAFDLSLYDFASSRASENAIRLLLEIVVVLLTFYVVKNEVEDMTDDTRAYFASPVSLFDIVAIVIVIVCIILYYAMVFRYAYSNFAFPLPTISETDDRIDAFNSLVDLSEDTHRLQRVVAFAVCIVFVRSIMLLCNLSRSWSMLFRTINQGKYFFLYFILIFHLLFVGFAFAGQFTFGGSVKSMSTFWLALLTALRMLLGEPLYNTLSRGDSTMVAPFYYVFRIIFYFILINIFLSIIVSSYDKEKEEERKQQAEDENPLSKIARVLMDMLTSKFGFLQNIKNAKYLFGSGSGRKINFERVNKLRAMKIKNLYPGSWECLLVLLTLAAFVSFITILGRVSQTYQMSADLEEPLKSKKWTQTQPTREMSFESIQEFEDVYEFARHVLLAELYDCTGTADPSITCAKSQQILPMTRPDYSLFQGPLTNAAEGETSIGFIPHSATADPERLPRVREWNVGITSANFVRITIQVACFRKTKDKRFSDGYAQVYYELHSNCAQHGCMAENIKLKRKCLDSSGNPINLREKIGTTIVDADGNSIQLSYTYTKEGTYQKLGGYSVGLGKTRKEAEQVLAQLKADQLFTTNSMSIVFDWAMYNGNVDLFMHQAIEFSMEPTNFVSKKTISNVFTFNLFTGGNEDFKENHQILSALGITYCVFLFLYVCCFLRDYLRHFQICTELQTDWRSRFIGFFRDDPWNIVDSVSVALNIVVLIYSYQYFVYDDNFIDTFEFLDNPTVAQVKANYDTLGNVETLGELYSIILNTSAFNAFFFTVRLLKYLCQVTIEVTYIKVDEMALEEMEVKWNARDRLLVVSAVRESGGTVAHNAGVRNGWVIEQIGETVVLEAFKKLAKQPLGGQFVAVEAHFVNLLKRSTNAPLVPLTVRFRSHTGVCGTFLKMLKTSVSQLLNFTLVLAMAMLGFIGKFTFEYGVQFDHFSTLWNTIVTLFRYMIGDFDIDGIVDYDQSLSIFNFILFQLIFYFILSNMFLVTMIQAWRQMRQEAVDGFLNNLGFITGNARRRIVEAWFRKGEDASKTESVMINGEWWARRGAVNYLHNLTEMGVVTLDASGIAAITDDKKAVFTDTFHKAQLNIALKLASSKDLGSNQCNEYLADDEQEPTDHSDKVLRAMSSQELPFRKTVSKRVTEVVRKSLWLRRTDSQSDGPSFLDCTPYPEEDVERLIVRLEEKLYNSKSAEIAEELWLDCFVICLEKAGAIDRARALFKYERQFTPDTNEEIRMFEEKKNKFAKQLQCVLKLIRVKSATQHHAWIGRAAATKRKVIANQNIVFHEFLEDLESKTEQVDEEISEIHAKTRYLRSQMRTVI
eukprot:GEMP01000231.1.p1 GENE.GEMP01000231.1~~GEMP01000231.1.p1  ORF type:complete len:1549 (+),score=321.39 GEMP01000231.1:115-4761(+)